MIRRSRVCVTTKLSCTDRPGRGAHFIASPARSCRQERPSPPPPRKPSNPDRSVRPANRVILKGCVHHPHLPSPHRPPRPYPGARAKRPTAVPRPTPRPGQPSYAPRSSNPPLPSRLRIAAGAGAPDAELRAPSSKPPGKPASRSTSLDRPDLSSFVTPSTSIAAPIQIAISTGGVAPILARLLAAKDRGRDRPRLGLARPAGRTPAGPKRAPAFRPWISAAASSNASSRAPAADLALAGGWIDAEAGLPAPP